MSENSRVIELTDSRRFAMLDLAESFIWRHEVKEHQFRAVLTVLESLGYLSDMDLALIDDDLELIFPEVNEKAKE